MATAKATVNLKLSKMSLVIKKEWTFFVSMPPAGTGGVDRYQNPITDQFIQVTSVRTYLWQVPQHRFGSAPRILSCRVGDGPGCEVVVVARGQNAHISREWKQLSSVAYLFMWWRSICWRRWRRPKKSGAIRSVFRGEGGQRLKMKELSQFKCLEKSAI